MSAENRTFRFPRRMRLAGARQFQAVYESGVRKHVGPLIVYAVRNELPHLRLGLSVSRRVGNAVTRHRIKRLLREAFRLSQTDLPGGYDVAVRVRPHETLALNEYIDCLRRAIIALDERYKKQ